MIASRLYSPLLFKIGVSISNSNNLNDDSDDDFELDEDDDDGFDPIGYTGGDSSSFGWKVDDFLSLTSINPVQNRIITAALNKKANLSDLENDYVDFNYL
mgnify:CR=1 FL=1